MAHLKKNESNGLLPVSFGRDLNHIGNSPGTDTGVFDFKRTSSAYERTQNKNNISTCQLHQLVCFGIYFDCRSISPGTFEITGMYPTNCGSRNC